MFTEKQAPTGGIKAYENRGIVILEALSILILHSLRHLMEHFGFSEEELGR